MAVVSGPRITRHEHDALSKLRGELQNLYGARLADVRLYGSRARGDARDDSDYNVAVILRGPLDSDEEIERTLQLVSQSSLENHMAICGMFVSDVDFRSGANSLLQAMHEESAPI